MKKIVKKVMLLTILALLLLMMIVKNNIIALSNGETIPIGWNYNNSNRDWIIGRNMVIDLETYANSGAPFEINQYGRRRI